MFMFEYMVTHGYPQIAGKAFFKGTGDQREVPSLCHAPCGSDLQIWLLVEDFEKKLGQNDPWDVGKQLVVRVYIYLSFQILQICRVQTKTLGLAVIMLKTLGLSQKTRVFLQTVRIRYSACFQHFSYFASSYVS